MAIKKKKKKREERKRYRKRGKRNVFWALYSWAESKRIAKTSRTIALHQENQYLMWLQTVQKMQITRADAILY
jgi:hypothetical protein